MPQWAKEVIISNSSNTMCSLVNNKVFLPCIQLAWGNSLSMLFIHSFIHSFTHTHSLHAHQERRKQRMKMGFGILAVIFTFLWDESYCGHQSMKSLSLNELLSHRDTYSRTLYRGEEWPFSPLWLNSYSQNNILHSLSLATEKVFNQLPSSGKE